MAIKALLKTNCNAIWIVDHQSQHITLLKTEAMIEGKPVVVFLTYAPEQGVDDMHVWLGRLLREKPWGYAEPNLFFMTGI